MPTYDLECDPCKVRWDVIKPMSQYDSPEPCPKCGKPGNLLPALVNIDKVAAGSWNEQSWNPALGCYTRNVQHARQIAKRRGFEEIGNEKPETIHKHFDRQRDETRDARWAEADKGSDVAETLTVRGGT